MSGEVNNLVGGKFYAPIESPALNLWAYCIQAIVSIAGPLT